MFSKFIAAVALSLSLSASAQFHDADMSQDSTISLSELLRVIQFFNTATLSCQSSTEDGFSPGGTEQNCEPHDADFNPQDWSISLNELLRIVQLFNSTSYSLCGDSEDGFCLNYPIPEGETSTTSTVEFQADASSNLAARVTGADGTVVLLWTTEIDEKIYISDTETTFPDGTVSYLKVDEMGRPIFIRSIDNYTLLVHRYNLDDGTMEFEIVDDLGNFKSETDTIVNVFGADGAEAIQSGFDLTVAYSEKSLATDSRKLALYRFGYYAASGVAILGGASLVGLICSATGGVACAAAALIFVTTLLNAEEAPSVDVPLSGTANPPVNWTLQSASDSLCSEYIGQQEFVINFQDTTKLEAPSCIACTYSEPDCTCGFTWRVPSFSQPWQNLGVRLSNSPRQFSVTSAPEFDSVNKLFISGTPASPDTILFCPPVAWVRIQRSGYEFQESYGCSYNSLYFSATSNGSLIDTDYSCRINDVIILSGLEYERNMITSIKLKTSGWGDSYTSGTYISSIQALRIAE